MCLGANELLQFAASGTSCVPFAWLRALGWLMRDVHGLREMGARLRMDTFRETASICKAIYRAKPQAPAQAQAGVDQVRGTAWHSYALLLLGRLAFRRAKPSICERPQLTSNKVK